MVTLIILRALYGQGIDVSFQQDSMTVLNGIYIERYSTVTVVLSPICKPAQQGTHILLQEALHHIYIAQHSTDSSVI